MHEARTAALLRVVCPIYLILYSPGTCVTLHQRIKMQGRVHGRCVNASTVKRR